MKTCRFNSCYATWGGLALNLSLLVALLGGAAQAQTPLPTPGIFTSATNPALPVADWPVIGTAIEFSPGRYEFNDPGMMSSLRRFYQVRTP